MAGIVDRVTALDLPLDEVVVIGSGLLDALGLRVSDDVDIAVSERLFNELARRGDYTLHTRGDSRYLIKDDIEVWTDWGADAPFERLKAEGQVISGVTFVSTAFLIDWKRTCGRAKDLQDIMLLEGMVV